MEARVILIATTNKHKIEEINEVLQSCGYRVEPAAASKLEVQSNRLEDVAAYAAIQAYLALQRPVIVEDAGLFVEALGGFPGPYSSYVFKTIGIRGLLKLLEDVENRRAYFKSVIALAHSGGVEVFTGTVHGVIAEKPRGDRGFGYDPVFIPEGSSKTFAEMETQEKNKFSHRGKAARELCRWLRQYGPPR
ncbi:XTP/dITP diphosphatase [Hyperthermus butylicus]|uniref:dITP/XTP pyrophosphatase n=1 Tax=Hyperthermus butylicus (strain DSM 5456 / JCM 9403 / PLM1-5) TaxID=415426 RepID=IXTPA_HYPBU|nr:XTP/dITP diphosphatase [Hyperthermus butylicus]A2BJY7.1 RecName: Full=dITP/XTP pyrophosphatase; AltName: Full=Non-canonical purine NTP pyrophosphatase; AltName: Full=Non-standard purine NTP pyrophosphatase; AltName: Full=Nucleoside-triphosphate diphosphatase; AltName: Full=Nucleoside-triphosphate pyrophosphatase; Short=NTPase [Hyperthermus butylicus DSM 5456]ABM80298.1 nucleoside-triphosphatase [Hyperthermus butylicus DSM 5456]